VVPTEAPPTEDVIAVPAVAPLPTEASVSARQEVDEPDIGPPEEDVTIPAVAPLDAQEEAAAIPEVAIPVIAGASLGKEIPPLGDDQTVHLAPLPAVPRYLMDPLLDAYSSNSTEAIISPGSTVDGIAPEDIPLTMSRAPLDVDGSPLDVDAPLMEEGDAYSLPKIDLPEMQDMPKMQGLPKKLRKLKKGLGSSLKQLNQVDKQLDGVDRELEATDTAAKPSDEHGGLTPEPGAEGAPEPADDTNEVAAAPSSKVAKATGKVSAVKQNTKSSTAEEAQSQELLNEAELKMERLSKEASSSTTSTSTSTSTSPTVHGNAKFAAPVMIATRGPAKSKPHLVSRHGAIRAEARQDADELLRAASALQGHPKHASVMVATAPVQTISRHAHIEAEASHDADDLFKAAAKATAKLDAQEGKADPIGPAAMDDMDDDLDALVGED